MSSFGMSSKDAIAYTALRGLYDCIGDSEREYMEYDRKSIASKLEQIFALSSKEATEILNMALARTGASLFSSEIRIPQWLGSILPEDRMPLCLSSGNEIKASSSVSPFRTADKSIIPLLRHTINSKTPLCLRVETMDMNTGMYEVQHMLSENGIPSFIFPDGPYGTDDLMSAALYAYHRNGILLVPSMIKSIAEFTVTGACTAKFRLRIGGFKAKEDSLYDPDDESVTTSTDDEKNDLLREGIIVVDETVTYLSGKAMEMACKEVFGLSGSIVCRIAAEQGVRPDNLLPFKDIITEIAGKNDRKSLIQLICSFKEQDKDGSHATVTLPETYDISVLNTDIQIGTIEKMARKASEENRAFRILLVGPSGSGKSALAHYLASILGIPLSLKSSADVFFKNFGESEKAVPMIFKEAQKEHALLLFDEAETVLGIKANPTTSGGKTYNGITNLFLQSMEAYQGIMVCTTNYLKYIEPACIRRFHRVITVRYPDKNGLQKLIAMNFPDIAIQDNDIADLAALDAIGPGDIASVKETCEYMDSCDVTPEFIIKSLRDAAAARTGYKERQPIGFR